MENTFTDRGYKNKDMQLCLSLCFSLTHEAVLHSGLNQFARSQSQAATRFQGNNGSRPGGSKGEM